MEIDYESFIPSNSICILLDFMQRLNLAEDRGVSLLMDDSHSYAIRAGDIRLVNHWKEMGWKD